MSYAALRALYDRVHGLDPEARAAVLDAENVPVELRRELEALLTSATPSEDPIAARVERAAREATLPARIGPYRVLGVLGEGGMGTVLLGERDDGEFRRKVAIKLIRGHGGAQARERFRRERQTLAGLDHPNITALVDGGSSAEGEPWLAMAYVEGETLQAWLEREQPSLEARLSLFAIVCRAVAHAHQHLVVHRDLKPSNILVRADGEPVLLDFGIAKLLEGDTADAATASRVMTPAYASPEQLLGRPVTTATDVYGLGLVMYELMAGRIPDRGDAVRAASVELPPPSRQAEVATHPAVRAQARRLRGDLDKIVRRAVRTEPSARYPSALALAEDVEAWLAGRPVQAAGTHATYVFSRFVRRHRFATAAVGLALIASLVFAAGLVRERQRALAAEAHAMREAASANATVRFLEDLFSELDPELHPGRTISARELLDRGRDRLADFSADDADVRARLQRSLGSIYSNAGVPATAIELLQAARATENADTPLPDRVRAETALSRSNYFLKRFEEALGAAERAVALAESADPRDDELLAHALLARGVAEQSVSRDDDAQASFKRAQILFESVGAEVDLASVVHNRAWLAESRGDPAAALPLYEEAHRRKLATLGPDHPKTLTSLQGRSRMLPRLGRQDEAIVLLRDVLAGFIRVHGEPSASVESALNELGSASQDAGHYEDAQRYYERALAMARILDKGEGGLEAIVVNNLATLLEDRGDLATAETHYRRSLELRRKLMPEGHPSRAVPAQNLGRLMLKTGRLDEARQFATEAHAIRDAALKSVHPLTLASRVLIAQIDIAQGNADTARAQLAQVETTLATLETPPPSLRVAVHETHARLAHLEGRDADRIAAMRNAITTAGELFRAPHPRIAELQLALAEALFEAEQRKEARNVVEAIAPVLEPALAASSPVLKRLAMLRNALGSNRTSGTRQQGNAALSRPW